MTGEMSRPWKYTLFLLWIGLSCCSEQKQTPPPPVPKKERPPPPPLWPEKGFRLAPPEVAFPGGFKKQRIYVDAGHGSPGNSGNESSLCIDEQDHNLRVAKHLAKCLEDTGHFKTRLSRQGTQLVKYRKRLKDAKSFGAKLIISIHSDARGTGLFWSPAPGKNCPRNQSEPGFAILWADQGQTGLVEKRLELARSVASRMSAAGFLAYNGFDYQGLYVQDTQVPGVFVDRHQPGERILFLHGPVMPSVIIETHHAWDTREESRWQEEATLQAFCQAVIGALVDYFTP